MTPTPIPHALSREDGFSMTELLISTSIMLIVVAGALTTFQNALDINDAASQIADSSQNLRAGSNELVRDLMMAGRIIAASGVPAPNGSGAAPILRPGPPGTSLTFSFVADEDGVVNLPAITTGYQLGPTINGSPTDIVTILTVDGFMPTIQGIGSGTPTATQGVIARDGSSVTFPASSTWLLGDAVEDTPPIAVGDIVLFKNSNGMAIQTVTSKDATKIYFGTSNSEDWFKFNQRGTSMRGTIYCIKPDFADPSKRACDTLPVTTGSINSVDFPSTTLMRLLMITYYVDNTTTVETPRLTRMINHFAPQALAGVVEDLKLTYDLVHPTSTTVSNRPTLPYTDPTTGLVYSSLMIGKVNVTIGVRSEEVNRTSRSYVKNQITTSVSVRSLAGVDRYNTNP